MACGIPLVVLDCGGRAKRRHRYGAGIAKNRDCTARSTPRSLFNAPGPCHRFHSGVALHRVRAGFLWSAGAERSVDTAVARDIDLQAADPSTRPSFRSHPFGKAAAPLCCVARSPRRSCDHRRPSTASHPPASRPVTASRRGCVPSAVSPVDMRCWSRRRGGSARRRNGRPGYSIGRSAG